MFGLFQWLKDSAKAAVLHGVQEAIEEIQTTAYDGSNGSSRLQLPPVRQLALPSPTKQRKEAK